MYNWVIRIRKWLRLIYEFLFIMLIIDFVLCMSEKGLMDTKLLLILGVTLVVSYISREFLAHVITLLIVHGILGAGAYFLVDEIYLKVILITMVVGIFFDAAAYMKRGYFLVRAFDAPWDIFFLGVAISILAAYQHNKTLQTVGYISVIVMLCVNLFSIYLEGLDDYMSLNRRVKGIPINQMMAVNTFIVSTVICVIVTIILLADLLGLPKVVAGFCEAMLGLLKILVILIGIIISFITGLFGNSFISPGAGAQEIEKIVVGESILGKIIYFILTVLIIICAVYVLIRICLFVIKWLIARTERKNDMTEDLDTKKKVVEKTRVEKIDEGGYLSPEQRARRIYKKRVLSFKKFFMPGTNDTTGDIEEAMLRTLLGNLQNQPEGEAADVEKEAERLNEEFSKTDGTRITELYNAVRYGKVKVDKEYIANMKKAKL